MTIGAAASDNAIMRWFANVMARAGLLRVANITARTAILAFVGLITFTSSWPAHTPHRGAQVTLSALGQAAPLEEKKAWDPDFAKRKKIKAILEPMIPGFAVQLGGTTSMDITRPGVDKAYGIGKLRDQLNIPIKDMLFFGDALFPGGNDYPAKQAGVESIQVRDPLETKRILQGILACWSDK